MFGLFRDKALDDFAGGLAKDLSARIPPNTLDLERVTSPKFQSTLARALQTLFLEVQRYCREHDLGVLKKARLSKSFQDQMVGLGYSRDFVREVTMALAKHLTQI